MRLSSNGRYMEHDFPESKAPHREELFESIDGAIADIDRRLHNHLDSPHSDRKLNGIYVGDLGIVYTYYILGDSNWINMLKGMSSVISAQDNRVTFLESNMFAFIMEGNEGKVCSYAERAIEMGSNECEVLYGRAGCLLGLLFAKRRWPNWCLEQYIRRIAEQILAAGTSSDRNYLLWEWHSKAYLGAIHGTAGILFALCLCGRQVIDEIDGKALDLIKHTADCIINRYSTASGNIQSSTQNESDDLVHFCHGATGWVPLLCTLEKIFPGEYTKLAEQFGSLVWKRGLIVNKGPGICHGIGGSICALLELFINTRNESWLNKAQWFSFYLSENWKRLNPLADRPQSLFEGMGGAYFALSVTHVLTGDHNRFTNSTSIFPGFMIY